MSAGKGRATSLTAVIRPRLPGLARLRACQGQAGAAGLVDGQIRQERLWLSFSWADVTAVPQSSKRTTSHARACGKCV